MICIDFLATNDWHDAADPSIRRRWLHRIAAGLGLRLFAVDVATNEPVLIDPSREALGAIVSAAVGEPDDEPDDEGATWRAALTNAVMHRAKLGRAELTPAQIFDALVSYAPELAANTKKESE